MPAIIRNLNQPNLQIGGKIITDLSSLIVLTGIMNGAGSGNSTLRIFAGAGGRVVTAAKTFRIVGIRFSLGVAGGFSFGYCDNDVGIGVATALTNAKYYSSTNAFSTAASLITEVGLQVDVPTGKYIFISNFGGATVGTVEVFGYEY